LAAIKILWFAAAFESFQLAWFVNSPGKYQYQCSQFMQN